MHEFWLCFIPLFVAVDPVGVLPLYLGMMEGVEQRDQTRVIVKSMLTATVVSLLFLFGGTTLLDILGVTVADFMIAGGVLLFVISLNDLLGSNEKRQTIDPTCLGPVPIGVPLVAGPALLTTLVVLNSQYGTGMTTITLLLVIAITGGTFYAGKWIYRLIGKQGARTVSKIASLLLASIAVMLVRKGVLEVMASIR